jgi:hypothetical protein
MNRPWARPFPPSLLQQAETLPLHAFLLAFNHQARACALVTGQGLPLQFAPQQVLPSGIPYERFIAETGIVPTRDNLHDRYNALIWLVAPRTKALLNRHQSTVIQTQSATSPRGPIRDAATLWDENLAVLTVTKEPEVLSALLKSHDWDNLFVQHRQYWSFDWQAVVFGHALMEKLATPFKSITAHTLVIQLPDSSWASVDDALSDLLQGLLHEPERFTTKLFAPMPVMGIPGWHPGNSHPKFYEDPQVFRPAPAQRTVSDLRGQPGSRDP